MRRKANLVARTDGGAHQTRDTTPDKTLQAGDAIWQVNWRRGWREREWGGDGDA